MNEELFASFMVQLENSQVVLYAHDEATCEGRWCSVHNRSPHGMRTFVQRWRGDLGIMERVCTHDVGHPDPDDAAYRASKGDHDTTHGCCGCCLGHYYHFGMYDSQS